VGVESRVIRAIHGNQTPLRAPMDLLGWGIEVKSYHHPLLPHPLPHRSRPGLQTHTPGESLWE